ncbi:MAG: MFS transporter [Myxococcota bacterium]|nr:MFS transporter [Myxococcota bacterium]MDW8361153.1 MFS transporter [Myxococcales bacterium]
MWAASGASLLTDVSTEMVTNVLPLWMTGTLGLGPAIVGIVEGGADAVASLVRVGSGMLSDRLGARKPLAVAGYALSALAKALLLVVTSAAALTAVRWTERLGKGLRTAPRDALIADSVPEPSRGRAFGLHKAADTLGAALGIGVALLVVGRMPPDAAGVDTPTFHALVALSLVPAALAVGWLAWGAIEPPRRAAPAAVRPSVRALGRSVHGVLLACAFYQLGAFAEAFLILRAVDRGASPAQALGFVLLVNLVYAASSLPAGWLADRMGPRHVLVAGWLLHAGSCALLAVASAPVLVVVGWLLFGFHQGLVGASQRALLAAVAPPALRATAFGTHAALVGLTALPASLLLGWLWENHGPAFGFAVAGSCAALGAVLLATDRSRTASRA